MSTTAVVVWEEIDGGDDTVMLACGRYLARSQRRWRSAAKLGDDEVGLDRSGEVSRGVKGSVEVDGDVDGRRGGRRRCWCLDVVSMRSEEAAEVG